MAYTFKLAHGGKTGKSLIEKDHTGTALAAEAKAAKRGVKFLLPTDTVVADLKDTGKLNKRAWSPPRSPAASEDSRSSTSCAEGNPAVHRAAAHLH